VQSLQREGGLHLSEKTINYGDLSIQAVLSEKTIKLGLQVIIGHNNLASFDHKHRKYLYINASLTSGRKKYFLNPVHE
jgi:hypothetical protein